ncbi:hypothetical protein GCM10023329_43330 [Streptomyces sanyensis]|uniref:Uncharacterized protein n=1 Tax=Streptomyces sanyensis TaxID=568869 RepID=A0ABP9B0L3_9ACTN
MAVTRPRLACYEERVDNGPPHRGVRPPSPSNPVILATARGSPKWITGGPRGAACEGAAPATSAGAAPASPGRLPGGGG